MDGCCENLGRNSLGNGLKAPISGSPYHQCFLNSGLADPRDLGSCVIELVTRPQLMVGNFGPPRPPWTAVERQGIQSTQPRGCRWVYGRHEGWVGGREQSTSVHATYLGASLALQRPRLPQATPQGQLNWGQHTMGAASQQGN